MSSSKHAQKLRTFRPDPDEYDAAEDLLDARGKSVPAYLRACLRWLEQAPDIALEAVGPHWPPPRPRGRPRSQDQNDDQDDDAANAAGGAESAADESDERETA